MTARPAVVGHRGAMTVAPENTMASFTTARTLGADAVELDLHLSLDGHLVVHHDYALDRTTSGTGPVFAATWDELAGLDAGWWFDPAFAGEPIPRLDDVLALDHLELEIELKGYGDTIVERTLAAVEEADALDRVELTAGNPWLLAEVQRRQPAATTGLFTPAREPWMTDEIHEHVVVGWARSSPCPVVHVNAGWVTASMVAGLRRLGRTVHVNDVRTAAQVEWAVELGADRVSANDVGLVVATLDALDGPDGGGPDGGGPDGPQLP